MQRDSLDSHRAHSQSPYGLTPRFLFTIVFLCLFAFLEAQAQVNLQDSMVKQMPFVGKFAATAEDIIYIASKVIGAGLCLVGVKNIGSRNWEHAIPGLLGGTGLFFLPQIIEGLKKIGGAT
jgi:hypothetical protein